MCSVSAMMDYGRMRVSPIEWTRDSFTDFQEILKRLDALDKKLSQPECHDPSKAIWMREVEERLSKLENVNKEPVDVTPKASCE